MATKETSNLAKNVETTLGLIWTAFWMLVVVSFLVLVPYNIYQENKEAIKNAIPVKAVVTTNQGS
jgi:hypothetical protein